MICKLTIGCQDYLFPDEKGLQTVMRCLSKAIRIRMDNRFDIKYRGSDKPPFDLDQDPVEVQLEMLPNVALTKRRRKSGSDALEPEIMETIRGELPSGALRLQAARRALTAGQLRLEAGS